MSLRDWPRPIRLAIAYSALAIALIIVIGGATLLSLPLWSGRGFGNPSAPWSNVLMHYSTLITAPIAALCGGAVTRHYWRKGDRRLAFFFLLGAFTGLGVGMLLIPITGGASLISGPPFSALATLIAWTILRLKNRSPANPPTSPS